MDGKQPENSNNTVTGLFNYAYPSGSTIEKSENSFRASRIYPYNPDQFNDYDIAPSCMTDASIDTENVLHNEEISGEVEEPESSTVWEKWTSQYPLRLFHYRQHYYR